MSGPFDALLPTLAAAFGERAEWQAPDTGALVPVVGRFRIDPVDVAVSAEGEVLNVTQTTFYADRRDVARADRAPGQGDLIRIRGVWYEVTAIDADDLGEMALRLLKAGQRVPASY